MVSINNRRQRCDNGWCILKCRSPTGTSCSTKKSGSKNFQKLWLYRSRLYSRKGSSNEKLVRPYVRLNDHFHRKWPSPKISQTSGSYSKSLYGYGKGSGKDIETSLAEVRAEKEAAKKGMFSPKLWPSTFKPSDRPLYLVSIDFCWVVNLLSKLLIKILSIPAQGRPLSTDRLLSPL